jgi:hypothetical protein
MFVDIDAIQPQSFASRNFSAGAQATNGQPTRSVTILSDTIAHADEMRALLGQAKALLPDHSQHMAAYARSCDSLAASLRLLITKGVQ